MIASSCCAWARNEKVFDVPILRLEKEAGWIWRTSGKPVEDDCGTDIDEDDIDMVDVLVDRCPSCGADLEDKTPMPSDEVAVQGEGQ